MLENIALIKEVHEHIPTKKAQDLASEHLAKINLRDIGTLRQNECSQKEKFFVLLIRALMTKEPNIIIIPPFSIINSVRRMENIIKNIEILNDNRQVYIYDIITNKMHYEGCICHTIE